jgi:hypothetical protein
MITFEEDFLDDHRKYTKEIKGQIDREEKEIELVDETSTNIETYATSVERIL